MYQDICTIDGCNRKMKARKMCDAHYQRFMAGRPLDTPLQERGRKYASAEESFAARTRWNGDCLEWTGSLNRNGYGRIVANGSVVRVHRWVWEQKVRKIPDGIYIDHICGNTACCNIDHLREATPAQNSQNVTPHRSNNRSGYRGVYWDATRQMWRAQVNLDGKLTHVGRFESAEEAHEAVQKLRIKHYEFSNESRLPIPDISPSEPAEVRVRRELGRASADACQQVSSILEWTIGDSTGAVSVVLDESVQFVDQAVAGNGNLRISELAKMLKAGGYLLEVSVTEDPDSIVGTEGSQPRAA